MTFNSPPDYWQCRIQCKCGPAATVLSWKQWQEIRNGFSTDAILFPKGFPSIVCQDPKRRNCRYWGQYTSTAQCLGALYCMTFSRSNRKYLANTQSQTQWLMPAMPMLKRQTHRTTVMTARSVLVVLWVPGQPGLQCEIILKTNKMDVWLNWGPKQEVKSVMLSEGPEVGRDRHLLLQAKHSLNQQKQETLPWQTAAKKDVDYSERPWTKGNLSFTITFSTERLHQISMPPSLYALEDVKACCSYRPIFLELKSALTMCANTFAYDTTKQLCPLFWHCRECLFVSSFLLLLYSIIITWKTAITYNSRGTVPIHLVVVVVFF